jgi:hypothetical protein
LFIGEHVRLLWRIGWLRADRIESEVPLDARGLIPMAGGGNSYAYADERTIDARPNGWPGAITQDLDPNDNTKLLFHPFRYYVLYHIERILRLNTAPMQMLFPTPQFHKVLHLEIESFQRISSQPEFVMSISRWNTTSALSIYAEPCFHEKLFGTLHSSFPEGSDFLRENIRSHLENGVGDVFFKVGLEFLEGLRGDLCVAAESLDPNKDIHTLLRLTRGERRLQHVRGTLGGSLCLLTMAEVLRRGSEFTFDTLLKEEDELGFGIVHSGVKERIYGSARPIDADYTVRNHFIRTLGLDFSPKLKWYVEGDTEYHAIESIIGRTALFELVNLRGHVVERRDRGVAFRENLRLDLRVKRFSFISIDGDRPDFARVVRRAAKDDEICGMFFIASPDFEFQNFSRLELEEIILQISIAENYHSIDRERLHGVIEASSNAGEMLVSVRSSFPELREIGKGSEWGIRLMAHAWENPIILGDPDRLNERRQIVQSVEFALGSVNADYLGTRTNYRVDPSTGRPIARSAQVGAA